MKLSSLVNSEKELSKLLDIKLPVKIAYKISKLVNKVKPELEIFDTQRNKLIKELGKQTNEETDEWTVLPENLSKFKEEITKLLNLEVNLEFGEGKEIEKIKIEDLGDIQLDSKSFVSLDWLFE